MFTPLPLQGRGVNITAVLIWKLEVRDRHLVRLDRRSLGRDQPRPIWAGAELVQSGRWDPRTFFFEFFWRTSALLLTPVPSLTNTCSPSLRSTTLFGGICWSSSGGWLWPTPCWCSSPSTPTSLRISLNTGKTWLVSQTTSMFTTVGLLVFCWTWSNQAVLRRQVGGHRSGDVCSVWTVLQHPHPRFLPAGLHPAAALLPQALHEDHRPGPGDAHTQVQQQQF